MPQNELHRRAVQWIADEQREHPQKKLHDLVDEAGMRFNLGPQDCRFLLELLGRPASPDPHYATKPSQSAASSHNGGAGE